MKFNSKMILSSVFAASLCVVGVSAMQGKKEEQKKKETKREVVKSMALKMKNGMTSAYNKVKETVKREANDVAKYLDLEGLDEKLKNDPGVKKASEAYLKARQNVERAYLRVVLQHFKVQQKLEVALEFVKETTKNPESLENGSVETVPQNSPCLNIENNGNPNVFPLLAKLSNCANFGSYEKKEEKVEKKESRVEEK